MPAKGTFGNAGQNILRNPGIHNWDLSITKRFPIKGEGRWMQFRTEMFNALNKSNFRNANLNRSAAGFGQVRATFPARQVQFGLRLVF